MQALAIVSKMYDRYLTIFNKYVSINSDFFSNGTDSSDDICTSLCGCIGMSPQIQSHRGFNDFDGFNLCGFPKILRYFRGTSFAQL